MPKKQVVFNQETGERAVLFTMDKPKDAPEGFTPVVHRFDLTKINEETLIRLALHGASQKIGDSYAGAKDSGEDPVAYADAAVRETIQQLVEGKWAISRTGTGAPRVSILVMALAKVKGITLEEALDAVGGLEDEEKTVLSKNKKIAAAMAGIRAEQAVERAKKAEAAAAEEEKAQAEAAQA